MCAAWYTTRGMQHAKQLQGSAIDVGMVYRQVLKLELMYSARGVSVGGVIRLHQALATTKIIQNAQKHSEWVMVVDDNNDESRGKRRSLRLALVGYSIKGLGLSDGQCCKMNVVYIAIGLTIL